MIVLSPNLVTPEFAAFLETERINLVVVGKQTAADRFLATEELVTEALRVISSASALPALLVCRNGRAAVSLVVACMRKLQRWSLIATFEEYRRFAGGGRPLAQQVQHEQFIELFDTDLVPVTTASPAFWPRQPARHIVE